MLAFSGSTALSAAASFVGTVVLVRTIVGDLVPGELQSQFLSSLHSLFSRFSPTFTVTIDEFAGFAPNQLFEAADVYLGAVSSPATRRVRACKHLREKDIVLAVERGEEVIDVFDRIPLRWTFVCHAAKYQGSPIYLAGGDVGNGSGKGFFSAAPSEVRYYMLSFHKKYKDKVLGSYLQHVLEQAKVLMAEKKGLKLFTLRTENLYGNLSEIWTAANFDHPATFQTLAMDPELKRSVIADLDRFVKRRDYYKKVGKAWKRGYLLYGPPGTGKSSLIAAIANYLGFNIYDLELSILGCNSELRKVLITTANRSILVVEDIDCTIDFRDQQPDDKKGGRRCRDNQVTLSGLLNFVDGLWSTCADERIIIFTTNHKEKLSPALLRPGRMDVHIHMSYCRPSAFRVLASNYLGLEDHHLFKEIEAMLNEVEATPAEIAEELMKDDEPDIALRGLVEFLRRKKLEGINSERQEDGAMENNAGGELNLVRGSIKRSK